MTTRILVGKCGIDKHDRGAIIVSRVLRDAGFEVVYVPSGHSPAELARIAADEDVDAVGLSLHSGAHEAVFAQLVPLVRDGADRRISVFAGGTIPPRDVAKLLALGVDEVFTPGASTEEIVTRVRRHVGPRADRVDDGDGGGDGDGDGGLH